MLQVVYSDKQIAESGSEISPSAMKPKWLADRLKKDETFKDLIAFIEPEKLIRSDYLLAHSSRYVDGVLNMNIPNGFGNYSQAVIDSLPYTNGAMYTAARRAIEDNQPKVALVSGFHHAGWDGYNGLGYFCTFNGLMITAQKLVKVKRAEKVTIVDCDAHWGNGTDDIIRVLGNKQFTNISFGYYFTRPNQNRDYLEYFEVVYNLLDKNKPDVILYQSGADTHIQDPIGGGILSEEEMYQRDLKMFIIAKELNIPLAWNLAGGYKRDPDGGCSYVLHLHLNTFRAWREVYG